MSRWHRKPSPPRKAGRRRQVISQRLTILPCGIIRGGTIGFSCHPGTGELYYTGEVHIRSYIFTHRHRFDGTININPKKLRSENIVKGNVIHCGPVRLTVETRYDGGADVIFKYKGAQPGAGTAHFDLSGEYVRLVDASGDGVIFGDQVFGTEHVHMMVEDGDRDS